MKIFFRFMTILIVTLMFTGQVPLVSTLAAESGQGRYVTIDFNDVDINLFIKYISELTGKNFVVDRAVKGKVTIISPTRISEEDAYRVFESVMEVHGFTTIPSGSIIKIVPSVQARSKSVETIWEEDNSYPEDKVVTRIVSLTHSDPREVKKILAPLISKTSVVIAHTASGMLIITDIQSNIARLMEIIEAIDVPSIGEELVILPLENASATTIAKSINSIFIQKRRKSTQKGIAAGRVKIVPYERTNSLIVLASETNIQKIRELLAKLDVVTPKGEGKINVYYLQHANAEELVKVLMGLPSKKTKKTKKGKAPVISRDMSIMADKETNSLIITAERDEYSVLKNVIEKLDIPRRMVYIEALIMEVKVDKSFEIGVQWGGGGSFHDETGQLFSGFSGNPKSPYNVLTGIKADPYSLPAGFAFGILKKGIEIGGITFPNLGAVLNAYRDDSDVNIIATPQILTTDNTKAEIRVGENVPFITSKNTTSGTQQDYTNYEYKDVSTSLEITPQINQENIVRLEIAAEIIKLKDPNAISDTPTTLKRSAKTTVIIHDQETVVIGGIIGEDTSGGEYKVPLLGDIPILGWLFKTRSESLQKTNLFIFITPRIVENPAELARLYRDKKNVMEQVKQGSAAIIDATHQQLLTPEAGAALIDLGYAGLQSGKNKQAKVFFTQALALKPENPRILIGLGILFEREGLKGKAAEMYTRVINSPADETEDQEVDSFLKGKGVREIALENLQNLGLE